jgi:hypothetical protein
MAQDSGDSPEYLITFGPFTHLRVGCVWTLDIGSRFGLYGIGWRHVGWRRIEP